MEIYYSDIIYIISILITLIAQIIVSSSYSKYKKILNSKDYTGYDTARRILDNNGLEDIMILETKGNLTDHYDPKRKVIKLSTDIYHGSSIASVSVAAHECGHAIQDKNKYLPMRIRSAIVPFVNICTRLGYFVILISLLFNMSQLLEAGIILLLAMLLFQLITLPVEFNASKRALKELEKEKILSNDEKTNAKSMLSAAAFTYVASVLTTLLEIFRLILISNDRRR